MSTLMEAKALMLKETDFLRWLGYQDPIFSSEDSRVLGESLLLRYHSGIGRIVEIGYSPGGSRSASASVFVSDDRGNRFSLEDWISERSPDVCMHFVACAGESDYEFLTQLCRGLRVLANGALRGTFAGSDWDAVSFDWKGYR